MQRFINYVLIGGFIGLVVGLFVLGVVWSIRVVNPPAFAVETPLDLVKCVEAGPKAVLAIPARTLQLPMGVDGWMCYPSGVR